MLVLAGCTHKNPLSDMAFQTTMAPPYVIANWYKITNRGQPIKVYIEGDGNAFDEGGLPTDNPTPKGEFMRKLAANDPSPNVAYLGRPCQYLQTGACSQKDWTTGRFSSAVIDSMNQTMLALMKKAKTDKVILIGFSGGAQIAGWLALKNPSKVQKLITLSGVLDSTAWTAYHGDEPLRDSLNLKDKKSAFLKIPQIHYAGGRDDVVPLELIRDFVGPERVIVVPKAGHGTGFDSIYHEIYEVQ